MVHGRSAFRYRVDLPARIHLAQAGVGGGLDARTLNLGRTGMGMRLDWPLEAEPETVPSAGDPIRVEVHDEQEGHPLIRQWSGRIAHARVGRGGGRLGIAFEWPNGLGARSIESAATSARPGPMPGFSIDPGLKNAAVLIPALALIGLAADQASKLLAARLPEGTRWQDFFEIVPIDNPGALAGFTDGSSMTGLACAAVCVSAVGIAWRSGSMKNRRVIEAAALGLLAAGLLGNTVDRLALGHVRDFLVSGWLPHWAFNLADVFIVAGASAWLLDRTRREASP